ncbi:MAG: helix-turn-helix domain-containing protein [Oscillospiraceae bacterium]|nr:helix-turn-helix domain-containing protein [Oscillospiraceae bacterium]
MSLGIRIREARLRKQMTQKDVVGDYMTRNMLSKIENGSATPSVKTLSYLSGALELPMSYFVDEDGEAFAPEQLTEISRLADLLAGEERPLVRAAALCLRARVRLCAQDAQGALELLEAALPDVPDPDGRVLVFKAMEDCCAQMGDYKKAYDIALKRTAPAATA